MKPASPTRLPQARHLPLDLAACAFAHAPVAMAVLACLASLATSPARAADAAGAPSAAASAAVDEAPALDGVTVRSRNRQERLQDVPISISVVTGGELDRLDAYGVDAIAKRASNVSWNIGNQRTSSLSIRGIGRIGQTEAQDPSVGVIVDGVAYAYNALTSSFDFVDLEAVEVARGPQGTLLGKNASVGSVTFTTRKPSFTPTADASIAFESRDGVLAVAALGGPVVDGLLAWRGTFSVDRQQGDQVNQYNRDITYTNTDRVSGRVQFLLTPAPSFSARLEADLQPRGSETTNGRTVFTPTPTHFADGSVNSLSTDNATRLSRRWFTQDTGYTLADYYDHIANDNQRGLVTGSRGLTADLKWTSDAGYALTSITAYKDYHFDAVNDEGTPFDVYRNAGGFWNDYRQVSQELRVTSPTGGVVDWQGGLYLLRVRNSVDYRRAWGDDAGAWFASPTQYTTLDVDPAGRGLMLNSLANVRESYNSPTGVQDIENRSAALYAQANWHLSDAWTLTTGVRATREDRTNRGRSTINDEGSAPELDPVSVNGVALGGFATTPTGALVAGANSAAQLALADATAQKYFGVGSYASLSAAQQKQVAAAKAIRAANIGVLFDERTAQPFRATLPSWVLSPAWKIDPTHTAYVSWQHGEKAGIAQFVNGVSSPVKAEKTNAFEAGLKSSWLQHTLVLDVDAFLMRMTDYQQGVRVVDQYTTALDNPGLNPGDPGYVYAYTTATGNVPQVSVRGLEFDGAYSGLPRTTLRFSGAYNRARYDRFPNAAQPVENGYAGASPYRDVSGLPLAGAPRYTFNVGADYRQPVSTAWDGHASANVSFNSSYYTDVALSSTSGVGKSTLVDLALGLGRHDRGYDASLIVKNAFGNDVPLARTWNSYTPALPRTFALQFTAKL